MSVHSNDEIEALTESPEPSESSESETANGNAGPLINDSLNALLESNWLMQQALLKNCTLKRKVYVSIPDKFDGKVGDFIEAWLEQFETWFHHREQVKGPLDPHTCIDTTTQNTKSNISIDLTQHEANYGQWMMWEAFSEHMKEAYGSSESGYTHFMHLLVMMQESNDTVNAYYWCFRCMLNRQKKTMKHPDDKHLYHFMFIAGLKPNINAEVLRLPESLKMEDMKFNEVLESAKRAEQTISSQLDVESSIGEANGDRKVKMKDKSSGKRSSDGIEVSREKLTPSVPN